jgi:hypothetical protein
MSEQTSWSSDDYELNRQEKLAEIRLGLGKDPINVDTLQWLTGSHVSPGQQALSVARIARENEPEVYLTTSALVKDVNCVQLDPDHTKVTVIVYTKDEWLAFLEGVKDGEFNLGESEIIGGAPSSVPAEIQPTGHKLTVDENRNLIPLPPG